MRQYRPKIRLPSQEQTNKFDFCQPMLESLFREMKELSKKAPDGRLNTMKVKMINRVLADVKTALSDEPTMAYLDLLDDETLPSNSDVVLILGQYTAAAHQFKGEYHKHDTLQGGTRWFTVENT